MQQKWPAHYSEILNEQKHCDQVPQVFGMKTLENYFHCNGENWYGCSGCENIPNRDFLVKNWHIKDKNFGS